MQQVQARGTANPHLLLLLRLAASKGLIFLCKVGKQLLLEEFGETPFYHLHSAAVGQCHPLPAALALVPL